MTAYLITGEAGVGKSSVAAELQRRGYLFYGGDKTPNLTYHADSVTGQLIRKA
jgi:serine kinase of HPr protein (carbohydrate metabolism regulator)